MSNIHTLFQTHKTASLLLFCSLFAVSSCDQAKKPDNSWENAVQGVYSASLSDDARFSAIGSIQHGGSLWDIDSKERLFNWNHRQGEYSNIIASGFSPNGNFALTADHQTMVLWDTQSGASLTFWTAPNEVLSLDLGPNGDQALLGLGDYSAVIFDVKRGGVKHTFYHKNRVSAVAFSNDGTLALTGSEDSTAVLWNVATQTALQQWQHEDEVVTVALSPNNEKAFTVAKYDKAVIWNTDTGQAIGEIPLRSSAIKRGILFTAAIFSEDGKLLLTGTTDRLVQLWNADTLKLVDQWRVPKRNAWKPTGATIQAVAFGKNRTLYAIASDGFTHKLSR